METKIKDKLYFFHIYHYQNYFLFVRIKSIEEIFCHDFREIALRRQCKHSKKPDHFFARRNIISSLIIWKEEDLYDSHFTYLSFFSLRRFQQRRRWRTKSACFLFVHLATMLKHMHRLVGTSNSNAKLFFPFFLFFLLLLQ